MNKYLLNLIQGQNLNLACGVAEALVFVGTEACKVNSLDSGTLYCTPPDRQPDVVDASGRKTGNAPFVKVNVSPFSTAKLLLLLSLSAL